jgi:hypothetical protein
MIMQSLERRVPGQPRHLLDQLADDIFGAHRMRISLSGIEDKKKHNHCKPVLTFHKLDNQTKGVIYFKFCRALL